MIIIYGTNLCPDCEYLNSQIKDNSNFKKIDIFENTKNLKEFLLLRDTNKAFDSVRGKGGIGIPAFLLEDGTVTIVPEEVGLKSRPEEVEEFSCGIEGKGC